MAEAVKPKETKKIQTKTKSENNLENNSDSLTLEERLRSLTSFVNGLIDEKHDDEGVSENNTNIENHEKIVEDNNDENNSKTTTNNDAYYNMIAESAQNAAKADNTFNKLNNVLENIKLAQLNSEKPAATAPPLLETDVTDVHATAPPLFSEETSNDDDLKNDQETVIDFYADKIKEHQKTYLVYPKLKYFQREKTVADATQAINTEEDLNDLLELDTKLYINNECVKELELYFYSEILNEIETIEKEFYLNRNTCDLPIYYGKNEFYELLKDYFESRLLVTKCVKHIDCLRYECNDYASHRVWLFEKYSIESSSFCGDNIRVKSTTESEKAFLNKEELNKLEKLLGELRFNIKFSLISSKFCSKLTYSKIESYLNEFFTNTNDDNDTDINENLKIVKIINIFNNNSTKLDDLNLLIDISFYFLRKKLDNDEEYYFNINKILFNLLIIRLNLVSVSKVPTSNDLNFMLILYQHLLHVPNCYTQLDEFINNYLKLPEIKDCNNDLLNFYLKIISLFTTKLKSREYFLHEFYNLQQNQTNNETSLENKPASSNNWLFIDLDGNLENIEQATIEISEDDLIKLYSKIEFDQMFSSFWCYLNEHTNKESIMKIYSFLNYLTRLLVFSIIQYNRLKYKNFCKLISKTLSNCLKYCSLISNRFNENLIGLSKHYDDFIRRICIKLIYYKNLNSIRWSLLSLFHKMTELSLKTKWTLLALMCGIDIYNTNFSFDLNSAKLYIKQAYKYNLEEYIGKSKLLTDIELISYLRTLHFLINLKNNQIENEFDLIKLITIIIFHISYVYESTRDLCHKDGTAILYTICLSYPNLIGVLLKQIDKLNEADTKNEFTEKSLLSLINQLPFHLWFGCLNDYDLCLINYWLNNQPTNSFKFRLILICIEKLNFDFDKNNGDDCTFELDEVRLKQIKMSIILFHLYSKLTNQFSSEDEINESDDGNSESDKYLKLKSHFLKLNKDYKTKLINWLWSCLIKLTRIYTNLYQNRFINYIEGWENQFENEFNRKYLNNKRKAKFLQFNFNQFQVSKFYMKYLSRIDENSKNLQFNRSFEYYLCLFYTHLGHNLGIFLTEGLILCDEFLKYEYYIPLFNIIEEITFNLSKSCENDFNLVANNVKLIFLIQRIFLGINIKQVDFIFEMVYRRRLKELAASNFNLLMIYVKLWFKFLLQTSVRQQYAACQQLLHWYKCKNVLKYLDLLLQFVFIHNQINNDLINEFLLCVYIDFGLIGCRQAGSNDETLKTTPTNNSANNAGIVSTWIQPSINWLTTTISSTTSAYTNLNGTNFDEVFVQQQLIYDKSIYKDYSFLGFYLSLCEERVENEIDLWQQLKSYLHQNSIELISKNIENYWKKLIQQVNKIKNFNLNQNLSLKRLMLYKWCERASELDFNSPLLALYWQKFFNIYLNHSTSAVYQTPTAENLAPVVSATLNYFSSLPTLSTFLKQMKKSLENVVKYYKTKINETTSDGQQYKSYYQNLVKIIYAFSLWIDETRLHDANLYLPGLPLHYEPELLAKIFRKNFNLWYEYVNISKINENLMEHLVTAASTTASTSPTRSSSSKNLDLFFENKYKESNSVSSLTNKLNEIRFECALKEKFGVNLTFNRLKALNIEQIELIKRLCHNLLNTIYTYNNESIQKNLNLMFKLDEKYVHSLLVKLYSNQLVEKYVQVPCKSLINPLHQCQRPALIKFVYEAKEKHSQTKHEIKDNRHNYSKIIDYINLSKYNFPNDDCIKSMISLQSLIKKLLSKNLNSTVINNLLKYLFYLLIETYELQVSNDDSYDDYDNHDNNDLNDTNDEIELNSNNNSINIYLIDLINLIGYNYIKSNPIECALLLDNLIRKLNVIKVSTVITNTTLLYQQTPTKTRTTLINTTNSLLLIKLCAQYIEPNYREFLHLYSKILNELVNYLNTDIVYILNLTLNPNMLNYIFDLIKVKYEIYIKLLSKFSIEQLKFYLNSSANVNDLNATCYQFVEKNIEFLLNLKLSSFQQTGALQQQQQQQQLEIQSKLQAINDKYLKLIINTCVDNFVSILDLNYPLNYDYMFKTILQFSSNKCTIKYLNRHLKLFINIMKKRELFGVALKNDDPTTTSTNDSKFYLDSFDYLKTFFQNEANKYEKYEFKQTFLAHWSCYAQDLADLYEFLLTIYIERFLYTKMFNLEKIEMQKLRNLDVDLNLALYDDYYYYSLNKEYEKIWELVISLYQIWLHPINGSYLTSSDCQHLEFMFDSFLNVFKIIYERLTFNNEIHKKYLLNKLFNFYYLFIMTNEKPNEFLLNLHHKCLTKLNLWIYFEPDNQSLNYFNNLLAIHVKNNSIMNFLAFTIASNLNLTKITDNYYKLNNITPTEINFLLKCWLNILTKFCLNDSIRESNDFELKLRSIYNQAETLQWSLLSDDIFKEILFDFFCPFADLKYVFSATRGSPCGLYISVLKSAAEFYNDNNTLSCFSAAKRRYFLKAICNILLKSTHQRPNVNDQESYRNSIMNILNDIETVAVKNGGIQQEINLLIEEVLVLIQTSSLTNSNMQQLFLSFIEAWITSSKDSPLLLNFINRLSRGYKMINQTDEEKYCSLIELCIEVYFQSKHHNWDEIMNEIDLKMNLNNDEFELKCLETSNYLLLYAYMLQQIAIIKASEDEICGKLFKYCIKLINSFSGSNGCTYSKPKSDKEEKFVLILHKILETFLELVYFGYLQHDIVVQLQQLCSILLFNSEDSWNFTTPCAYQMNLTTNTTTSVLATIGLSNLLAKRSTFSLKFRMFSRCLAFALLRQINIDTNTNQFKLRMNSKDDNYSGTNANSAQNQCVSLLNQQIKQATTNFNSIQQLKNYSSLIEHANYAGNLVKAREFGFAQIFDLIKYLNGNLFEEKFYLF